MLKDILMIVSVLEQIQKMGKRSITGCVSVVSVMQRREGDFQPRELKGESYLKCFVDYLEKELYIDRFRQIAIKAVFSTLGGRRESVST